MSFISEKTIQAIFDTVRVDEVVGDFVHLKRRGINYLGLCPFHHEKTPSFTVSPAKGIYKCFGCGEGGNSVNFIMNHEQLSYVETLRYLANKYNIPIEEETPSPEYLEQQQLADSLYIVNEFAQLHFQEQLFQTDYGKGVGLSYFKERGLREEIIRKFGLGFANGQNNDLVQTALQKGYQLDILQKAGLAASSGRDFFRMRVLFPIHNLSGKVLGFGGRMLGNDKKQPKYLNTPETEIYHKNRILYGIHQARKAIMTKDCCFMVEGYMDVLSLVQAGIENVVASSGTSLTVGQIQLVKRYTPHITILYDGDAAGIKAALRGLDLVIEQDMNVKVVLLPNGEDPDSYLQKVGVTAFQTFIEAEAVDFVLFKTRLLLDDAQNDPVRRAELVKDIVETLSKMPDALKRAVYVKECSALMDINEHILHTEINKRIQGILKKEHQDQEKESQEEEKQAIGNPTTDNRSSSGHELLERDIVRILVQFGDRILKDKETVAEYVLLNMADLLDDFDSKLCAKMVMIYIEQLDNVQKVSTEFFTQHPDAQVAQTAIDLISTPYEFSHGWERLNVFLTSQKMPEENHVADAVSGILRFKLKKVERIIEKNTAKIKDLQEQKSDFEQLLVFMKAHTKLTQLRTDLAKQLNTVVLK